MPISDWLFDAKPESVLVLSENKVVEFDFNGQRLNEVPTNGTPTQLISKSGKLIVLYSAPENNASTNVDGKMEIYQLDNIKQFESTIR
ncbi:MAG: hypothetical protein AAF497_21060, partial [Planctomycetota bacterium]